MILTGIVLVHTTKKRVSLYPKKEKRKEPKEKRKKDIVIKENN